MMDGAALAVRGLPAVSDIRCRAVAACSCKALAFSEARCSFWTNLLDTVAPRTWRGRIRNGKRAKRFALSILTGLCVGCRSVRPRSPHPLFPVYLCSRCAATKRYEVCSHAFAVQQCQLAQEPPLLSALDTSLACLPTAYPSMNMRLCFVDIYGTRFPVRGQGGDPARKVRFYFSEDVLRFRSCAQGEEEARNDARRRGLIHARLPLLTAGYAEMVRRHTGGTHLNASPEDIDEALTACEGPGPRQGLLEMHREYVGLRTAATAEPLPFGSGIMWCPHCGKQPEPGERCVTVAGGGVGHLRCVLSSQFEKRSHHGSTY